MTERGLPIVDGAPACPFVAFEDERDERAASPDHRHRCYAEAQPAPRALAHQEAYCLSSAFPVCPTFQDWARREAARSRADASRRAGPTPGPEAGSVEAGGPQRNPPRSWAAPPPWLARGDRATTSGDSWAGEEGDDEAFEDEIAEDVPRRARGLAGSYADRVASDPADAMPGGLPDDDLDEPFRAGTPAPAPPAGAAHGAAGLPGPAGRPRGPFAARPEASSPSYRATGWDEEGPDHEYAPARIRRRERDAARVGAPPEADARAPGPERRHDRRPEGPAPEWERAKPLEAYPTLRSRRLPELSVPPILVAVVAIALAAAVLFALPGLLGFGAPQVGSSASPTLPVRTGVPSFNPTPVPAPTPTIYVVAAGDTLSRIAGRFGVSLEDLIAANAETLPDPNKLQIGQELIIPVPLPTELPAASEIPGAT